MMRGNGQFLYDIDNNKYLDFLNNYTSLVLGHAHPEVAGALAKALPDGWVFGAPHTSQVDLAERICRRIPGVRLIRFCNSGSEAVMHAVRTARVVTGTPFIIKMEGGYHGSADSLEVSIHPDTVNAGSPEHPLPIPENRGITPGLYSNTLIAPFNNADACQALLEEYNGKVAGLLVEPMMGSAGAIPPQPGYLERLRQLTTQYGCLLIFDEVQTLRFNLGGAQTLYGVMPDITAMGKIIGGGFPIGAFGGSYDTMSVYDPQKAGSIPHSGTFNGHPLAMIAGAATLDVLDQDAISHINALATRLSDQFRNSFQENGIIGQVTGAGSILNVHFTGRSVVDYRTAETSPQRLTSLLHLMLIKRGVFCAKRGMFNISLPMRDEDIEFAAAAFDECLRVLRLAIIEDFPHLIIK